MMTRRACLALAAALAIASALPGCKKEERCQTCGMRIDHKSVWRAEADAGGRAVSFDSPRCALEALLRPKPGPKVEALRVQEFYSTAWRPAANVRFVLGSDVLGPMGQDLVPVDPERVAKFIADHHGRAVSLGEITPAVLTEATGG
jgi:nitrous oxide reductase accessory protein NosL